MAALIAVMMEHRTPETLEIAVEAADFNRNEVLGIPAASDISAVRKAMLGLASIYHPDKGGLSDHMVRVNAADEEAPGMTLMAVQRSRGSREG